MSQDLQQLKGMVGTALVLACFFPDAGEQNSPPQGQPVITAQKGTEPSQLREQLPTEHHLQQVLLSAAVLNSSETPLFTPQLI